MIENFAKTSGLKLNKQKTDRLKIKNCNSRNAGLPLINWAKKAIKVLGTQIDGKFQINLARSNRKST